MQKIVRDGQVAVLVSLGFGAGWSTWNTDKPELVFDPGLVDLLLNNADKNEILSYVTLKWGEDIYTGGLDDLVVQWVPLNARFRIEEYDGAEKLKLENEYQWFTA